MSGCTLCGSGFHNREHCPWKGNVMKKTLVATLVALALAGCSGLNVSWVATATYNSQAVTQSIIVPGAVK
jgi:hypothetical protein